MPQVPVKNRLEVGQRALNAPRVDVDTRGTHGEGLGQALQQVGQALGQKAQEFRRGEQEVETLEAQETKVRLAELRNRLLYDPEAGALNVRGRAAVESTGKTLEEYEKGRKAILAGLKSERVRQAMDLESRGHAEEIGRMLSVHQVQEVDRAADTELDAQRKQTLAFVANAYGDAAARERAQVELEGPLVAAARRKGLGREATQAVLADWRREVSETVLAQYVARQDASGAKAYLGAVREHLGESRAKWEREVEGISLAADADVQTQALLRGARVAGTPWVDAQKARDTLAAMPGGRLKDEVTSRLNSALEHVERERQREGNRHLNLILATFYSNGNNRHDRRILEAERWLADPTNDAGDLLARWKGELEQHDARRKSEKRADSAEAREARRAQNEADRYWVEWFEARQPEFALGYDIDAELAGKASPTAREIMRQHQNKVRKAWENERSVGFRELTVTIAADAERAGLNKDQEDKYRGYLQGEYLRHLSQNGDKEPTRQELNAMRTAALQKSRSWFSSGEGMGSRYRFESKGEFVPAETPAAPAGSTSSPQVKRVPLITILPNGQLQEAAPGDPIPPAVRADLIQRYMKKHGRAPSEQELRGAYDVMIHQARGDK